MLPQPDEGAKCQHVLEGVHGPRSRRNLRCEQRACLRAAPVAKLAGLGIVRQMRRPGLGAGGVCWLRGGRARAE